MTASAAMSPKVFSGTLARFYGSAVPPSGLHAYQGVILNTDLLFCWEITAQFRCCPGISNFQMKMKASVDDEWPVPARYAALNRQLQTPNHNLIPPGCLNFSHEKKFYVTLSFHAADRGQRNARALVFRILLCGGLRSKPQCRPGNRQSCR